MSLFFNTGILNPSSNSSMGGNDSYVWVNPQGAYALGGTYASHEIHGSIGGLETDGLKLKGFPVSTIPDGDIIRGIEIHITRRGTNINNYYFRDLEVSLSTGFTAESLNKADLITAYSEDFTTAVYGGPTDTWGYPGLSTTIIKNVQFGVIFKAVAEEVTFVYDPFVDIDVIQMKVYYGDPIGGSSILLNMGAF